MGKANKYEEQYGPIADQMAQKYGLDPRLFRNQIRQESGFNPQARSGVGAVGIGQFMPGTAKQYGYTPEQLIQNPTAALEIAAKHMRKLSDTYGDQRLALAAYNGGGGSIDFVKQKLGKKKITYEDWMKFNEDRRKTLGNNPTAWHGQTLDYVKRIVGANNPIQGSPSKKTEPMVTPPNSETPLIQAPTSPGFDYFENLHKQRQGNENIQEVPQSASGIQYQANGQMDDSARRMQEIAMHYHNMMREKTLQDEQRRQESLASQEKQNKMTLLQQGLHSMAQSLQQPQQQPIELTPIQPTQEDIIVNNPNVGFGGFLS